MIAETADQEGLAETADPQGQFASISSRLTEAANLASIERLAGAANLASNLGTFHRKCTRTRYHHHQHPQHQQQGRTAERDGDGGTGRLRRRADPEIIAKREKQYDIVN